MQIFPRQLNLLPKVLGGLGAMAAIGLVAGVWYYGSPKNLQVGYAPTQPVPYSHPLHAGALGLDCRHCHSSVERSQEALLPPTQTCMECHATVRTRSPLLEPVRQSWASGDPIPWVRVHKLPEHVYFDHSAHIAASVGCVTCHGRIDQMQVVHVSKGISMGWCLDCHRNPIANLRPQDRVTDMGWEPDDAWTQRQAQMQTVFDTRNDPGAHWDDPAYRAREGIDEDIVINLVNPPQHCSGCHR